MNNLTFYLGTFIIFIIPMIFAITLHEAAHAYTAKLRGDKTAYLMGRVTLNPIKHIDILGTIILPSLMFLLGTGVLFGWAKPIPIDYRNFKNPRQDRVFVALAGPLTNFFMAIIWFLLWKFTANTNFQQMAHFGVIINLILMTLNMLPIPPLDGSRIVSALLPKQMALKYDCLENWGFLIIGALLLIPFQQTNVLMYILLPLVEKLYLLIQLVFI